MKDARVRYNPAEKRVVVELRVRCFCLARRDLTAVEMAHRFVLDLERIELACAEPGPFVFAVHENRVESLLE